VQLRIVDVGIAVGFLSAGQFVKTDIEDVGDFDNSAK
jgi:hypothetical protein